MPHSAASRMFQGTHVGGISKKRAADNDSTGGENSAGNSESAGETGNGNGRTFSNGTQKDTDPRPLFVFDAKPTPVSLSPHPIKGRKRPREVEGPSVRGLDEACSSQVPKLKRG